MNPVPQTSNSKPQSNLKSLITGNKVSKGSANKETNGQQVTPLNKKVKRQNYRWTALEHHRYVTFLADNIHLFKLPYQQKIKLKIQVMISEVVQHRNSYQCRSHHQKMLARYGSIENIIKNHFEQLQVESQVKVEQLVEKPILNFTAEGREEQRMECKVQQQDEFYIHKQQKNQECQSLLVIKEEEQVLYRTFV